MFIHDICNQITYSDPRMYSRKLHTALDNTVKEQDKICRPMDSDYKQMITKVNSVFRHLSIVALTDLHINMHFL